MGCWAWCGFLQRVGDESKPLLMLNVDETSVKLCPSTREGWVVADRQQRESLPRQSNGASLRERRSALSFVAFLSDSEEVQRLLPQVFLSNEHVLSEADVEELNASTAPNVVFARRKSGWVNSSMMVEILEALSASLGAIVDSHRIVLCMDTYSAHLNIRVVRTCRRLGFLLFYIPASMTGWMQPLDVSVFKKYKQWVVEELERKKASGRAAVLPKCEVMRAYAAGVQAVLENGSWRRAFELTGLKGQSLLSKKFLQRLGSDAPPVLALGMPSAGDLAAVYPRRRNIPVDDLFALVLQRAGPSPIQLPERARLTVKGRPPPPLPPPADRPAGVCV